MSKKSDRRAVRQTPAVVPVQRRVGAAAILVLCTALYFIGVCLTSASTVKMTALALAVFVLASVFLFFTKLRKRIGVPLLLLTVVVVMGGVSTL